MLTPGRFSSISEQHSETSMRSRLSELMIRTIRTFSGCGEARVASASWIASRSLGKWMGILARCSPIDVVALMYIWRRSRAFIARSVVKSASPMPIPLPLVACDKSRTKMREMCGYSIWMLKRCGVAGYISADDVRIHPTAADLLANLVHDEQIDLIQWKLRHQDRALSRSTCSSLTMASGRRTLSSAVL